MEGRVALNQAEQRRLLVLNHLEKLGRSSTSRLQSCWAFRSDKYGGCELPTESAGQQRSPTATGQRPAHAIDPGKAVRVVELAAGTTASTGSISPRCSRDATVVAL